MTAQRKASGKRAGVSELAQKARVQQPDHLNDLDALYDDEHSDEAMTAPEQEGGPAPSAAGQHEEEGRCAFPQRLRYGANPSTSCQMARQSRRRRLATMRDWSTSFPSGASPVLCTRRLQASA